MGYRPDSDLHRVWWKNSLEQIVGSSDSDTFAMDPPILVLWLSRLLLDSRSRKEEEQVMESDTQGRIYQIEELES